MSRGAAKATLGALIGSRICHDLISPVGAISNGIELLGLAGAGTGPEMTLVSDSAQHANARLRFFRVAFGQAAPGQSVPRGEFAAVLREVYTDRIRVDWQPDEDLSRSEGQLAFLALMCAEQAIPAGGTVTIAGHDGALHVTATGPRVAPRPEHWAILDAPEGGADVPAAQVQFALLPILLAGQARRPRYSLSDRQVTLSV